MASLAVLQAEPYWGREIATPAMRWLGQATCQYFGRPAVAFGVKGDQYHLNGGHRSQEWILNSRHCTNRSYATERGLSGEQMRWLSAFDFVPATRDGMLLICQRLDRAVRAGHLEELVEWYGNTNGDQRVDGWDNIRNAVATSDSSHLWHLHGRFARRYAGTMSVMERLYGILTSPIELRPPPVLRRDDMAMIARDPATNQLYVVAGYRSTLIDPAQVNNIAHVLRQQGMLTTGPQSGDAEWEPGGVVRRNWSAAAFGPVEGASSLVAVQVGGEHLDALAEAVADKLAARLAT